MAEAISFGLVRKIIEKLGSTTFDEIGSIWGVKDEFQKLKNTVSTIQAVLQDAEEQQDKNHQVRDWLMKLRDAIYDADDLLSDFSTEDLRQRVMGGDKMAKKVRTFFSSSNQLAFRLTMAHKIKAMRERLNAIANDRNNFQLVEQPLQRRVETRQRDQTHSFIGEEEVIGREEDKKNIIDLLLNFDVEENVSFISIVGIGGLGKTTLAQYVYNDEKVKAYFELKMWVCVSDFFDVKAIAEKILGSATSTKVENLDMDQLQNRLRTELNQKKYLLVLDDVWNENNEKWCNLKRLLMGGLKGSKVVITTRTKLVAEITSTIPPYNLEGLSEKQSWLLFKQMAFKKEQETIDPNLEVIGKDIIQKCQGVPLVIKTLGRVLYFKKTEDEWSYIKDNELSNVTQGENDKGILPILKLSYNHLPSHLKCCFAYCSLFPKDQEIPKLTLIQLWIAQGFIQSLDEKISLEDVANEYCMELIWRSFFQEVEDDHLRNITSFKMHDLIHDLAQSISRTECTLVNSNAIRVNEKVRHLSFPSYNVFEKNLSSLVKAKKIRTFILTSYSSLYDEEVEEESTLNKLISSFRCLRVLDLHGLNIVTVPNSIDKLAYLKYLDLSENDIEVLPSSIIRLLNLQTIKLSKCGKLKELPRGIQKLVNLKHLDIYGCDSLTHMPSGLGELTSLQTLQLFIVSKDTVGSSSKHCNGLVELNKLSNLRGELQIKNLAWVKDVTSEANAANLKDKHHLRNLKLSWNWDDNNEAHVRDAEILLEGLQPHRTLKYLDVEGYQGIRFSSWLPLLTSLVHLRIWKSDCLYLPPLYQLPNLHYLYLQSLASLEYISDQEIIDEVFPPLASSSTTFFPSLKSLQLLDCPNLKGWWRRDIDVPTMTSTLSHQSQHHISLPYFPCLSYLEILNCSKLIYMPLFPYLEKGLLLNNTNLKPLQQTMEMMMVPSSSSSCPPFSKLKHLSLSQMQDIESFPEYLLQNLTSLEYLEIWGCPRLKSLSQFMQILTSLKKLQIGDCEEIDLFNEESDDATQWIGNLTSLQTLEIDGLPNLTLLPEGIKNLTSLQRLKIDECPNLTSLTEGISNLTSLQNLAIRNCLNLTSLPKGICRLTSLQSLMISECPHLEKRCQEGIGEDWPNIAHIPNFQYHF
ncbi:hypothetical protein RGQ29_014341 [Quercus rubra]|uniref:CC-NBS-LRR protein n=1 Tax=Quercus rubra TaxID=3512 RepID=A0AAN7J2X8_QUERU|nr:hypothetical protein RGQ29_014341 [Quercus rubra]